jgi:hypothetical protein
METTVTDESIEAEYMVEASVKCPHCAALVESLQVVRLLRARVNFTSVLPRRGCVMVCPACRSVLSGHLGSNIGL